MIKSSYQAPIKVFATPGSDILAREICKHLQPRLPRQLIPYEDGKLRLGEVNFVTFSNENIEAQVENVRDTFAVVINTQAPPVAVHFLELLALLDALVDADVSDILMVFPYMTFSRSDRKNKPRISTMGKRFAHIIGSEFGIHRVLLLDPHDTHLKHYFPLKAANEISAIFLFIDWIEKNLFSSSAESKGDWVVVYDDAGAAKKYRQVAHALRLNSAYIDKDRPDDTENPQVNRVVGDANGKNCLLVDDEILSGNTAIEDAGYLLKAGAKRIIQIAIHPVLQDKHLPVENLMAKIQNSPIEKFVFTDSIPVLHKLSSPSSKFVVLPVAPLLAESIARIVQGGSLTELHRLDNVSLYRSF